MSLLHILAKSPGVTLETHGKDRWIAELPDGILSVSIPEEFSDEQFTREFDDFSARLRLSEPGVRLLIIVRMKSRSRPANRERAKRFFQQEKALLKTNVRAGALVSEHVAVRGAILGVSLLGLFPFTVKTFEDVTSAQRWLAQQK